MTECQGCGAWNESHRALCVLCGTPLAETDEWDAAAELPPLPPLPDGGLASSMPSWLRDAPALDLSTAERLPAPERSGERVDPRTFLSDADFPRWLRDLAPRQPRSSRPAPGGSPQPIAAAPAAAERPTPGWPGWLASTEASPPPAPATPSGLAAPVTAGIEESTATPPETAPVAGEEQRPPAAVVAARTLEEHRARSAWETLLLVLLFLGVVVAAFWALVANGVFSPGV